MLRDFRPSSSAEENLSAEYAWAEQASYVDDCAAIYADCPVSIYDYVTALDVWTLFGVRLVKRKTSNMQHYKLFRVECDFYL